MGVWHDGLVRLGLLICPAIAQICSLTAKPNDLGPQPPNLGQGRCERIQSQFSIATVLTD